VAIERNQRLTGRRAAGKRWHYYLGAALAVAPAVVPVAALAQTATGLPTREQIDQARRPAPEAPTRLRVDGDIERSPCALADPTYAAIKVTLTSATLNNLDPVSPADLAPAYRAYLNTEQPIAVVCDIRDAAATILRRQGYIAAVQVPAQRIEGGNVKFEVLYAKLTALRIKGDAGRDEGLVARYLSHIATGQVFNRIAAERYLLLARDIPGLDVRLSLSPAGTDPGDMIGEIAVRRTPVTFDANIQNYAPVETGRFGGQLRGEVNGLTGFGDRTSASIYATADVVEQRVVQVAHDFTVGGQGLRLGGRFTYAWSHPTLIGSAAAVEARSLFANFEASYPFIRRQALSLRGAFGFDYVDQNVTFNASPLSRDRVRVIYARLDADAIDLKGVGPRGTIGWRLAGTLEVRQGLDIFDASPNCLAAVSVCARLTPPGILGDPTATVARFYGLAEVRLAPRVTLAVLPRAQVASASVLSFEQISAGNYTVGRGYSPGVLAGDSGIGFQTELRHDRFAPIKRLNFDLQPYGFVDTQFIFKRFRLSAQDSEQVTSVGAGARINIADRARLDLTVAVPLRDVVAVRGGQRDVLARSGDVRFLMSLTTRLVPWSNR